MFTDFVERCQAEKKQRGARWTWRCCMRSINCRGRMGPARSEDVSATPTLALQRDSKYNLVPDRSSFLHRPMTREKWTGNGANIL